MHFDSDYCFFEWNQFLPYLPKRAGSSGISQWCACHESSFTHFIGHLVGIFHLEIYVFQF